MLALLIEDDTIQARLFKEKLTHYDVSCIYSNNGQEGFDLVRSLEFDMVFIDNYLGTERQTLEGAQFWTFLFRNYSEKMYICGMSVNPALENMFRKQGACDFLVKPVTEEDLERVIAHARRKRESHLRKT